MGKIINHLRCKAAYFLAHCRHPKGLGLGLRLAPDTTSLIRHQPRRPTPLPTPLNSHLIYHQQTVDQTAAENALDSLADQIPPDDEVCFLDVGGTMGSDVLARFRSHEWATYTVARAALPEQRSYTFGMNLGMRMLKGERLFVWRTDYVYPPDLVGRYSAQMDQHDFACPYDVLVGARECDGNFVREHWRRLRPFDRDFWAEHSTRLSLYETQDPALFAIRRWLWEEIGGLNHQLWGYGWQFAEFAARLRAACKPHRLAYFGGASPIHQTHEGTLMHHAVDKAEQAEQGIAKFSSFLGGHEAYWVYRSKQILPPRPPD